MKRHPPGAVEADGKHPLTEAIGYMPRRGTAALNVYKRLLRRWTYMLPSNEHRRFVCAVLAADGDIEGGMYAAGLATIDESIALVARRARMLSGTQAVRRCIREGMSLKVLTRDDLRAPALRALARADGTTETLQALRFIYELYPDLRPAEADTKRETDDALAALLRPEALDIIRKLRVISPEGEINREDPTTSTPIPPERKHLGNRAARNHRRGAADSVEEAGVAADADS